MNNESEKQVGIQAESEKKKLFRLLRKHWLISLFITTSIGFLIWPWVNFRYGQTPCPPGVARHAPHAITHETCPSLGKMNGVKLAIPQHYLLGPKGYKGIDIWNAESYKKHPQTNSFDNELDNFSIKIRLTNFKPIETIKDSEDYGKMGSLIGVPPSDNRWIHVGIRALDRPYTFERTVELWLRDDAKRGPFVRHSDEWEMTRYISTRIPKPFVGSWEFLYDKTFSTFSTCEHIVQIYPPHAPQEICKLNFSLQELQAAIDVDGFGERSDLARWPEIERELRKVIQSFIVP